MKFTESNVRKRHGMIVKEREREGERDGEREEEREKGRKRRGRGTKREWEKKR